MYLKTVASAAALALALAASSVQAGIAFISYGTALPGSESLVTNFNDPLTFAPLDSMSGTGTLLTGSISGVGAAPAFSATTVDPNQYLAVLGSESETFVIGTPDIHDVSLYIGSLDSYNTIVFTVQGGTTFTYSGSQLGAVSGANNGNQTAANTNGRFVFSFAAPVTGFTVSSSSNSFEIADVAAAVPEPGTWLLMIAGAALMGAGLRQARRQGAIARAV